MYFPATLSQSDCLKKSVDYDSTVKRKSGDKLLNDIERALEHIKAMNYFYGAIPIGSPESAEGLY